MQKTNALPPPQVEDEWTPYSYGMLLPGEWFWLTHYYPYYSLPKEEPKDRRKPIETKQPDQVPAIRITFHARKS